MKDIAKIRQLLKDAIKYKGDYAYDYIIKKCTEALTLFPCETCGGDGVEVYKKEDIYLHRICPDCQS